MYKQQNFPPNTTNSTLSKDLINSYISPRKYVSPQPFETTFTTVKPQKEILNDLRNSIISQIKHQNQLLEKEIRSKIIKPNTSLEKNCFLSPLNQEKTSFLSNISTSQDSLNNSKQNIKNYGSTKNLYGNQSYHLKTQRILSPAIKPHLLNQSLFARENNYKNFKEKNDDEKEKNNEKTENIVISINELDNIYLRVKQIILDFKIKEKNWNEEKRGLLEKISELKNKK